MATAAIILAAGAGTRMKSTHAKVAHTILDKPLVRWVIDAAKEAQAMLETKINQLKLAIAEAKIIDTSRLSNDTVQILSTVEMRNLANNMVMKYTIVSESEANLREGKISSTTPIAQGLLGKKAGDVVEIKIPQGIIKLEILKISID